MSSGGRSIPWIERAVGTPMREGMFRRNSIDLLRLLLAVLVVVSHTWSVLALGPEPLVTYSGGATNLGALAVLGFFGLSGFLITRSYFTIGNPVRYLWHRVLRIMPGYWVCLVVIVLVFGPAFALLQGVPVGGYFTAPDGPLRFVWHNFFLQLRQEGIAGLPRGLPWAGHLDVALWTLIHEFHCYLIVAVLGACGLLRRTAVAGPLVTGMAALLLLLVAEPWLLNLHGVKHIDLYLFGRDARVVQMWAAFFVGASMFLWHRHIPVGVLPGLVALGVVALCLYVNGRFPGGFASSLLIPYGLLSIGLSVTLPRPRVDLSYGTYVYAWPIQQLFAVLQADALGVIPYLALVLATTFGVALASWTLVESRAMSLKDMRIPGLARAKKAQAAGAPVQVVDVRLPHATATESLLVTTDRHRASGANL